jgi:Fe-S-cluster containining protein
MVDNAPAQVEQLDLTNAPIRYFEWDYNNNVVVEYERLGECNGCGDCCMALIRFFVTTKAQTTDRQETWYIAGNGGVSTTGMGVWSEVQIGGKRRFYEVLEVSPGGKTCPHLTEDKRCDIHATKPLFHKVWPIMPSQVTPFERCSYSFREVGRRPIVEKPRKPRKKRTNSRK